MRALQPNPETGFLESYNTNPNAERLAFNSDQKLKFLQMAHDAIDNGKYPMVHEICRAMDVNMRTFEVHTKNDPAFKEAWAEVRSRLKSMYTGKLAFKADTKMGTLANLAMLRYLETGSWVINNVQTPSDNSDSNRLIQAKTVIIDAEVPDFIEYSDQSSKVVDNQLSHPTNNGQ